MTEVFDSIKHIKIFLNHYNTIDRKLYSKIKRTSVFLKKSSGIVISGDELSKVLKENFSNEIRKVESIPNDSIYKYASSIYFINRILNIYTELDVIEIEYIVDKSYTRLQDSKINFDFKVEKLAIDFSLFSFEDISYFRSELDIEDSLNLKQFTLKAQDIANKIDVYGSLDEFDEQLEPMLQYVESFLDEKILLDNSLVAFEMNKYKNHM